MDPKKRNGRLRRALAYVYARPAPTWERVQTRDGSTILRRKQWTPPGPLFDLTVVTLFFALGIPLLFPW